MNEKYDLAIIGGGIAGIASALRLKKMGYNPIVLEKNESFGGKLDDFSWNNYRWDKGPSLFTLPEQVDELFTLFGKDPKKCFQYQKMNESCHYYFHDKSDFLLKSAINERNEALKEHFSEEGQKAIEYIKEGAETYKKIGDLFIDHPKYGFKNIFDKALLKQYPKLMSKKLIRSLDAFNKTKFKNENLINLFNRYGTYNGSNPYKMSGLYSMISHLEINKGTYFPVKGMRSIVEELYKLAIEVGVTFSFNEGETKVKKSNKNYIVNTKKETYKVSKIVSAVDCVTFYKEVLEDTKLAKKYAKKERSSSAIVFYWAVEKIIPQLKLHNIFFGADYEEEFNQIFDQKIVPVSPTIYLHVSSVINPNDAPKDGQNWFLMINTPAGLEISEREREKLKQFIIKRLDQTFKTNLASCIKKEFYWDAKGIEKDTGSYLGALYGASSNSQMAALTRHGNKSKKYKNLYFCGGTVHPGGGIPLVLKSAKIVAKHISDES